MADPASELEYQNNRSIQRGTDGTSPGWASVGGGLGDAVTGASTAPGNPAFTKGLQVGAQTIDALAQARQRIQDNQSNQSAATQLRSPQFQQMLGLKPEEGEYAATLAEKGAPPQQVTEFLKGQMDIRNRQTLGDDTAPLAARHAAAMALSPASATPHEFGTAGSTFDPLGNGGSGASQVSQQQSQMNESQIVHNQQTGDAATSNAATNANRAANTNSTPKLATGNKWISDPQDPSGVQHDSNGQPVQGPDLNANKGEGAVGERYTRRIVNAQNGLAKEASNLRDIGLDADTGAQVGPGKGIMGTLSENAGKAFSSTQSQLYKSSMAGVERQLATVELAGQVPPGTYVDQLRAAVENTKADTPAARAFHGAQLRQIAEVAAESAAENPKISDQARDGIFAATTKIQQAIPWTTREATGWERNGKPGQSFQQYLDANPREPTEHFGPSGSTPAAPTAGPAPAAGGKPAGYDPFNILGNK